MRGVQDAATAPETGALSPATQRHRRVPWVAVVCVLTIAVQAYSVVHFVRTERPDAPAYEPRMTIDAATYVRRATEMMARGDALFTPDAYHSVGMQVLAANVFRLTGVSPRAVKLLNCALWLCTLIVAFFAFRRVLPPTAAWVTVTLVALSVWLQRYCAIVQYEVFASAALTTLFLLNVRGNGAGAAATSGAIAAVLAIFRAHFMVLVPALAAVYAVFPSARQKTRYLALVLGFLAIAVPWNTYYSMRRGEPFLFQTEAALQAHRYLSPNAAGYNYPYYPPVEPSGLRFIVERPGDYVRLLLRRFTYLTGIEPDIWSVEPRGTRVVRLMTDRATARRINAVVALALVLGGAALSLRASTRTRGGVLAVALIAVLVAPHAIVSSSTRYMVPAIPLLTLLQAQFILFLASRRAAREEAERNAVSRP